MELINKKLKNKEITVVIYLEKDNSENTKRRGRKLSYNKILFRTFTFFYLVSDSGYRKVSEFLNEIYKYYTNTSKTPHENTYLYHFRKYKDELKSTLRKYKNEIISIYNDNYSLSKNIDNSKKYILIKLKCDENGKVTSAQVYSKESIKLKLDPKLMVKLSSVFLPVD